MQINLARLKANLPEQETYLQGFTPGLFRTIAASHCRTNSKDVDWDSFTLDEAKTALEMAMSYSDADDDGSYFDEVVAGNPNEGNAIHEYLLSGEAIYEVKTTVPEKLTMDADFF